MSKLGLVVVLFFMTGRTFAHQYPAKEFPQPNPDSAFHFVLIQADPGRAFYIRIDDQVYGSSEGGHLILAQLRDSTYTIVLGFPAQTYPEQRFLLIVRKRDFALSLRKTDGRWALYDRKGQALSFAPEPLADRRQLPEGIKKDDAFSRMMSAIVRDTAVMYNTYVVTGADSATVSSRDSQPRGDRYAVKGSAAGSASSTVAVNVRASDSQRGGGDSLAADSLSAVAGAERDGITSSPLGIVPSAPTGVMKLSERKSPQALRLVFADRADASSIDTIDVVIPVDSASGPASKPAGSRSRKPRNQASAPATDTAATAGGTAHNGRVADSSRAGNLPAGGRSRDDSLLPANPYVGGRSGPDSSRAANLNADGRSGPDSSRAAGAPYTAARDSAGLSAKPALVIVNSDCHAFATDYDVDKLRVKMLDAASDADRVAAAHKVFKTKCFSSKQLRALSEVFTSEAGKFQFLQSAYPFDFDDQFPDLVDLFADPVYAGKFRTMTGRH
ncbi:MAG TPA: hypothetical protein VN616_09755 [Puia sp.]|nr:hypothetical protein [Puia sp.]